MKIWLVEHYGDTYHQYTDFYAVFDHKPSLEEVREHYTKCWERPEEVNYLKYILSTLEEFFVVKKEDPLNVHWRVQEMDVLSTPVAPLGSHLQAL